MDETNNDIEKLRVPDPNWGCSLPKAFLWEPRGANGDCRPPRPNGRVRFNSRVVGLHRVPVIRDPWFKKSVSEMINDNYY